MKKSQRFNAFLPITFREILTNKNAMEIFTNGIDLLLRNPSFSRNFCHWRICMDSTSFTGKCGFFSFCFTVNDKKLFLLEWLYSSAKAFTRIKSPFSWGKLDSFLTPVKSEFESPTRQKLMESFSHKIFWNARTCLPAYKGTPLRLFYRGKLKFSCNFCRFIVDFDI